MVLQTHSRNTGQPKHLDTVGSNAQICFLTLWLQTEHALHPFPLGHSSICCRLLEPVQNMFSLGKSSGNHDISTDLPGAMWQSFGILKSGVPIDVSLYYYRSSQRFLLSQVTAGHWCCHSYLSFFLSQYV